MIALEPFTPADFPELQAWITTPQLLSEWSGGLFSFPLSEDALHWYIEDTNVLGESDVFIYKAVDAKTGQAVGHLSLGNISTRDRSARLTRVLVGDHARRGQGICTQMIQQVLRIGFEELGLHRISLGVYTFNHGAIRCYLKCGFQKEGVLRDVVRYGDTYWSLVEMGILEDDWRALQAAAKATLA
ncbi:MAG: GNAT family N-acetyltransferase [Hymenobacteraceae bacterium]|nr:GNAT family N-acetyltransferase [Hymenobacteraceae bacterium]